MSSILEHVAGLAEKTIPRGGRRVDLPSPATTSRPLPRTPAEAFDDAARDVARVLAAHAAVVERPSTWRS
jgi:hypothetical protein